MSVKAYDVPKGRNASKNFTMTVNQAPVGVFDNRVNTTHKWCDNFDPVYSTAAVAIFDFIGDAQISIDVAKHVDSVVVRPLASGISPEITHCGDSSKITFTLSDSAASAASYGQYSVEINGDRYDALLIFASRIEEAPTGENVITVKSGEALYTDIVLKDGQTLYIEGGASLYGRVYLADNSTIAGRGLIDGSHQDNWAREISRAYCPIMCLGKKNVHITGVSILDPNCWVCTIRNSDHVYFDNVKIMSATANSDGISVQSSQFIYIDNSFLRTWDDSIVIKNYDNGIDSHDVYANNCLIWTDLAQCMEIGFETNHGKSSSPHIYNVEFKNITVLHQLHKAAISIHNADDAEIYNVKWENIVIEELDAGHNDGWNLWLDFTNVHASEFKIPGSTPTWSVVKERGTIHDITLKNISVINDITGSSYRIWANGDDDIYNIYSENAYTMPDSKND